MAMVKNRTMEEFLSCPINIQADTIAKLYIMKCTTEKVIANGRMSQSYFKFKKFFEKPNKDFTLPLLYEYLSKMTERREMTTWDLAKCAMTQQSIVHSQQCQNELGVHKGYTQYDISML